MVVVVVVVGPWGQIHRQKSRTHTHTHTHTRTHNQVKDSRRQWGIVLTRAHDAAKVRTADCRFELGPVRLDEVLEWNYGVETSSVVLVSRAIVCAALLNVVPSHSDDSRCELMKTQSSAQNTQAMIRAVR